MSVTQAGAATMKFRMVMSHTKAEIIEVGDVEGHIIGAGESTGLASLETGEVAVIKHPWTIDYTKGTGTHKTYIHLTFEDGSTVVLTQDGTTRPDPKGKSSVFEGTCVIIQGSGRYAGIKGDGSYRGRRVAPLGAAAQVYTDVILTYTLP